MSDEYLDPDIKLLGNFYLPPLETKYGTLLISQGDNILFIYIDHPEFKWSLQHDKWGAKAGNIWKHYLYIEKSAVLSKTYEMMNIAREYINTTWSRLYIPGLALMNGADYTPLYIATEYKRTHVMPIWKK